MFVQGGADVVASHWSVRLCRLKTPAPGSQRPSNLFSDLDESSSISIQHRICTHLARVIAFAQATVGNDDDLATVAEANRCRDGDLPSSAALRLQRPKNTEVKGLPRTLLLSSGKQLLPECIRPRIWGSALDLRVAARERLLSYLPHISISIWGFLGALFLLVPEDGRAETRRHYGDECFGVGYRG